MGDCLWSQKTDLGWARTEAKPYIGMFRTCKSTNISHCHHSYVWAYIFVSDVMLSDHSASLSQSSLHTKRPSAQAATNSSCILDKPVSQVCILSVL